LSLLKGSPFFGAWDPRVIELYVTYGFCEDSQGGVKLKMSGLYEALVFGCRMAAVEGWEVLERLDERIELRWIVPGKSDDKECVTLSHRVGYPDLHSGRRTNTQRGCKCGEDLLTHLMW